MIQSWFAFCSSISFYISTSNRLLFVNTSSPAFPQALQNITLTTILFLLICKTVHKYTLPQS